ncbi:MAG: SPOR domain-containing protein [Bacteroidia bacterium]|nr:SPOR domain-containing protein [Bacteroidia bacterium]NND52028.1 SPOR domain-containing protein [Flavobacteriaceae bacterium]
MFTKRLKFLLPIALTCLFLSTGLHAQQGEVTVNQDPQIDALLRLKKDVNKRAKNYKIQIYNGSRVGAENARNKFWNSFSGWSVTMEYETPNYKIWVGNFKTRLEADRALLRVKRRFSNAFIFKPKDK